ncbi:conserved hypothetical protein [Aggregatibacter segnis ATCC 33393]|uniref:VENN motif-containing domain-containing protein n=2 Tax=Aggregatibacter segnis TaxID=739 RepID=E6KXI0_9PAST|nr:conserved hypothetical protein [Aggregatibacter segnis ATCC 33393]
MDFVTALLVDRHKRGRLRHQGGNMQQNGTTSSPSVKISIGYGSQKQTQTSESQSIQHQKSTINTGILDIKARGEKVVFEGVDANAKLMALSGKQGIDIKGVKDEEHQRTENKSSGGSVGVFVGTNGNSYGLGIEGSVNVAKGKSNSDSERWQNSHLTADKIITNSEEGDLTLDAANLKAKRWEADIQNLTITSRQDTEKYESKQTSASASGSVAYGSGGGASVSASYNKAKVDYAQVNEQAGIRVGEDGMDANIHNHAQLNAAIIESDADESKNRFKTKSLTHTDIENRSEIKTESASISAGTGGINPMQALSSALSLLGNTNERERSTTKSAISGNIQIETETPENLTALSRDTKNANQRVEKQDLQKVQERQEMAKVIGDITNNAISIATYNEREKINKLSLEKFKAEEKYGKESTQAQEIGKQISVIQKGIDDAYGIGSEKGMAIRAVTAALQAAAQNDTAGSLVALASPYLNQKIHEMTAGDTAKDKATNLMAHALLSAVEFQVTGKDPLTGAIAGVTGEATAEIIARAYGKPVSELTANEKENISTLSQLAGGLASALTAKANGTTAEQGGSFLTATSGAETAKRAVENNYLSIADVQNFIRELSKAQKEGRDTKPILEKYKGISEENRQQLIACKGNVVCETAHLHEMNTGAEELERNLGFFSRMTVYYPNDLNTANRTALFNLVESENAESFSKLSDTTKFGLNAMEAGTATGYARVGLSNVKSLISGKNKAYPTSGMDGYKRTNVGDEDYRSSGAENAALYPKLKEELAMKQKAGFEKVVKDLSKKPTGSVLMIPDYRHQLSEARSTLSPKLQRSGNAAVAQINIDGLTTRKLVGHSQIDKAQGSFVGQGETKFESLKLPNKKGDLIDRRVDSEYKILSNLADQLGSNRQAKGQVTIFTERPACLSCLGVVDQFIKRYPNIKVNVFDNNGKAIKHNGEK